jgi:hypothetical protein
MDHKMSGGRQRERENKKILTPNSDTPPRIQDLKSDLSSKNAFSEESQLAPALFVGGNCIHHHPPSTRACLDDLETNAAKVSKNVSRLCILSLLWY